MAGNFIDETDGPVVFVNIFTVKPGRIDEFVALQKANLERSRGNVPGWRGSRLHRAVDGRTAIMTSMFDSIADHIRVHQTQRFSEHLQRVLPLIEKAEPAYYTIVHEATAADAAEGDPGTVERTGS